MRREIYSGRSVIQSANKMHNRNRGSAEPVDPLQKAVIRKMARWLGVFLWLFEQLSRTIQLISWVSYRRQTSAPLLSEQGQRSQLCVTIRYISQREFVKQRKWPRDGSTTPGLTAEAFYHTNQHTWHVACKLQIIKSIVTILDQWQFSLSNDFHERPKTPWSQGNRLFLHTSSSLVALPCRTAFPFLLDLTADAPTVPTSLTILNTHRHTQSTPSGQQGKVIVLRVLFAPQTTERHLHESFFKLLQTIPTVCE